MVREMNSDIKAVVDHCPLLHFQVNKGERHRIMHSGIRRGSLWITPRTDCYCVTPTGEVETLMYHYLHSNFGAESGQDGRYRWWSIADFDEVAGIIRRFGESQDVTPNALEPTATAR
jgi:hypothetical protein